MNFLITGANGQLGSKIQDLQSEYSGNTFFFTDVDTLDITNEKAIGSYIEKNKIDVLINCAAYTAVDKAESETLLAQKLNAEAPGLLAKACERHRAAFIHVSTDYVFSGKTYIPYREEMPTDPQSAYGNTKRLGELAVIESGVKGAIVRTSWLYSEYGNNFVKTMLRLGSERAELSVVYDQAGSPTYAGDLAIALLKLAGKPFEGTELYHFSDEGVCSWYDFAVEIMKQKSLNCKINPIESKDYPTPAERPPYSVFNKSKIKQKLNIKIPHWRDSLTKCLEKL
ncbi:MAG TPA: dTDP-4-dehydrorhamnose reductase [Bacteroidales bacterium]|nr:dTDP-4-dehydrorhamnose reductase [Bacteroidales bacterium]